MYFAIVLAIIVCICVCVYWISEFEAPISGILLSFFSGTLALSIGVLISCAISFVFSDSPIISTNETRINLIALQDNKAVNGGRYYIHENTEYTFLYNVEEKGIVGDSIPIETSYINYIESNEIPHIITRNIRFKNPILNFFASGMVNGENREYLIYIPEGSIIVENQYEIDLE